MRSYAILRRFLIFLLALGLAKMSAGAEAIRAQAEVNAAAPPVKLTLQVYRTKLKRRKKITTDFDKLDKDYPRGVPLPLDFVSSGKFKKYQVESDIEKAEPLWVRIGITNVGKQPIVINDEIFTGQTDLDTFIGNRGGSQYGTYLEVIGPDGKLVRPQLHLPPSGIDAGTITVFKPKTLEEKAEAEQEKLNIAKWLKAGYSTEKIKELLNAALSAKNQKAREKAEDALRAKYPAKHLRPGETIWTQPSAGQEDWGDRPFPARRPIGNFAEMNSYDMLRSGVYRVRAAYDERPNPIELKIDREKNIKPDAWEVKVVTPWVKVESR